MKNKKATFHILIYKNYCFHHNLSHIITYYYEKINILNLPPFPSHYSQIFPPIRLFKKRWRIHALSFQKDQTKTFPNIRLHTPNNAPKRAMHGTFGSPYNLWYNTNMAQHHAALFAGHFCLGHFCGAVVRQATPRHFSVFSFPPPNRHGQHRQIA